MAQRTGGQGEKQQNDGSKDRLKTMLTTDISFDFALFVTSINDKFRAIWDAIDQTQNQMQTINHQITNVAKPIPQTNPTKSSPHFQSNSEATQNIKNETKTPNVSNDGISLNYSDETNQKNEPQLQQKPMVDHHLEDDKNFGRMSQSEVFNKPELDQQRKDTQIDDEMKNMIFNKVKDLSQRMETLELQLTKQVGFSSRKFGQLNNEIEKNNQSILKEEANIKRIDFQINKLRDELSEYKLKKEAKLMRMASKLDNSSGGSSSEDFNNYLLDKIQQLSRDSYNFMTKEQFEDNNRQIQQSMKRLQLSLADTVTSDELNDTIKILSRRLKDINKIKVPKVHQSQGTEKKGTKQNPEHNETEKQDPEQRVQDEGDKSQKGDEIEVYVKMMEMEKGIRYLQEGLIKQIQNRQENSKFQNEMNRERDKKVSEINDKHIKMNSKLREYEEFMKTMNQTYNDKLAEMELQIIQSQESIEKINNQLKLSNHIRNKSDVIPSSSVQPLSSEDMGKLVQLQNQIAILKKKYNKLGIKMQSFKQDILNTRQDFSREVDAMKLGLQKKCDWESLKKSLNYFEERFKEIYQTFDAFSNSMQNESQDQTTAAKRGWTCLCCDKNIKQFEGKLSEAKFTNIFPQRYESPRIGGYFKQKQADKQYKQLYGNRSKRNSMPRQIGNMKSSKDELPSVL